MLFGCAHKQHRQIDVRRRIVVHVGGQASAGRARAALASLATRASLLAPGSTLLAADALLVGGKALVVFRAPSSTAPLSGAWAAHHVLWTAADTVVPVW